MSAYSVGRRTCFKGFKRRQIKDRLSRQEPNGGTCLSEQLQALSTSTRNAALAPEAGDHGLAAPVSFGG